MQALTLVPGEASSTQASLPACKAQSMCPMQNLLTEASATRGAPAGPFASHRWAPPGQAACRPHTTGVKLPAWDLVFTAACSNRLTDHRAPPVPCLQAKGSGIPARTGTSASSAPPGPSRTSGGWVHRRACRPAPRRPWRGPMSAYARLTCCRLTQVRRCAAPATLHTAQGA